MLTRSNTRLGDAGARCLLDAGARGLLDAGRRRWRCSDAFGVRTCRYRPDILTGRGDRRRCGALALACSGAVRRERVGISCARRRPAGRPCHHCREGPAHVQHRTAVRRAYACSSRGSADRSFIQVDFGPAQGTGFLALLTREHKQAHNVAVGVVPKRMLDLAQFGVR
jgi:hypothetical protein